MKKIKSLGLPRLHGTKSDIRSFLPSFLEKLKDYGVNIYMEEGYGEELSISKEAYVKANPKVNFVSQKEAFQQDLVIVLKAPHNNQLEWMKKGSGLISMLHYDSRPKLVDKLTEEEIIAYSMDSIVDDQNSRMVVTYELTALGGVRVAFKEMRKHKKDFFSKERGPIKVTIIGMGNLGIQAGKASMILGDRELLKQLRKEHLPGVMVQYLGRDVTKYTNTLIEIFKETDLLIDATSRKDFTQYIIPNDLIKYMKEDAIILDLTADPYDTTVDPIQVKAIEGLTTGNLDKYVFQIAAEEYNKIPYQVSTKYRRLTISNNGWPGVLPLESMKAYEEKLLPFIDILLSKGHDINIHSSNLHERALFRSTLEYFLTI